MVVLVLFSSYPMSWYWYIFGMVEVIGFFTVSTKLTKQWGASSERVFVKNLFSAALIIRVVWVIFSYWFYSSMNGKPFEFNVGDAEMYHNVANEIAMYGFHPKGSFFMMDFSDRGYPAYLGFLYMIFGSDILIVRLIKAILGAYTCVLVYKLSTRTFNDEVGRMAGIFCMLMPNLIYYCGLHLKEVEMLFIVVVFLERSDYALRSNKIMLPQLILPISAAISLFFFRTVLGAVALLSFLSAIVFSSDRLVKKGKKFALIIWIVGISAYFGSGKISSEVGQVWETKDENQTTAMKWYSEREGGNRLAKDLSGPVFVPMIFIIPLPTIVGTPAQENSQLIHGGNYVKNITAFFTMFALIWVIVKRKWGDYVLIGSFSLGYLMVIAFSAFAHSERFHIPTLPMELAMAAFGVSLMTNQTKKYYNYYLIFILIAIIGWSWFKLAGRGVL